MEKNKQNQQVDENFKVFQDRLPELLKTHEGKFALMRDKKIVGFYETLDEANKAGLSKYKEDKIFSIQEVTDRIVDLGFFSNAMSI